MGSGLTTTVVAEAVGVTPSEVSQLLADSDFAKEVAELRTINLIVHAETDKAYDEIEKRLLEKLGDSVEMIYKPKEILSALQMVNSAKRKSGGQGQNPEALAGTVINLRLPNIIVNNYKINMAGGMVEVGGRSLAPMPSGNLIKTLEERRENDAATKQLPAPAPGQNYTSERIVSEERV